MGIREDFLAKRTAELENGFPPHHGGGGGGKLPHSEHWEPDRAEQEETQYQKKEDDLDNLKGLSLWARFDFSNLILQGWRKWCRRRFALSSRVNLILMEGAAPTSCKTKAFYSSLEQIQHRQGYISPLASPNGAWSRHRDRKQAAPFRACFLFPFIAS